jgi:hypothetical protein
VFFSVYAINFVLFFYNLSDFLFKKTFF